MKHFLNPRTHMVSVQQLLGWSALIVPIALVVGSASALFLRSLDVVTRLRWNHPWLLYLLPLGGLVVGLLYHWLGRSAEGGNNLILDEIHKPGGGVPARMAPLVLAGTLITHLLGGSAGREGTAVQMGGALASFMGRLLGVEGTEMRIVLMAGIAAGFGSVFGTPLTGAVFAMEVLAVGRVQYEAVIPVLIASTAGDVTCSLWGIRHAQYHIDFSAIDKQSGLLGFSSFLLLKIVAAGVACGMVSMLFSELTHWLQRAFNRAVALAPMRPLLGGVLVIVGVLLIGNRDYLGIGVLDDGHGGVTIGSAFQAHGAERLSWLWKILFTAATLSSGFKGGEVTPLLFIGATLGNTLAWCLNAPVDLFAGLGFVAVFAGAANTPLACTLMGAELFGARHIVYFAVACFIAYFFSGHSGIFLSQRVAVPKRDMRDIPPDLALRDARQLSRDLVDAGAGESLLNLAKSSDAPVELGTPFDTSMLNGHKITVTEIGKVRIYLAPTEKVKVPGFWARLNAATVYREIIRMAKRDGILNASAYNTHHGFTNGGRVETRDPELGNARLTMCVELIDQKEKLEQFCRNHARLLENKVVIYKHVERWSVHAPKLAEGRDEDGIG
jgi:H+/Cl- antiporter ClcA/PII-like signaling protein